MEHVHEKGYCIKTARRSTVDVILELKKALAVCIVCIAAVLLTCIEDQSCLRPPWLVCFRSATFPYFAAATNAP